MLISKLAGAFFCMALAGTAQVAVAAVSCPDPNTQATADNLASIVSYKQGPHQKMLGYFRIWRDIAADPTVNKTSMADLPACLDVAIVFPYNVPDPNNPVWAALKNDYAPLLHGQGTKLVWSVFVDTLLDSSYPNNAAGYDALAQHILDTTVNAYGIDGIDVDVEKSLSASQLKQATGVFHALARSLGPKSGSGKLLIYDTNLDGTNSLFRAVHADVDYVLVQSYGRAVSGLQNTYNSFKSYITPSQYFIGFSFYEENGTAWNDVTTPLQGSRAYSYATWQPSGARKGGIFAYAIDRDGVATGDNTIEPTDYGVTRTLISVMNP